MTQKTYWDNLRQDYQYVSTQTLQMIVGFILDNKPESVFEASTGTGILPAMLRRNGYKEKYLGSDYCENFIKHAKANNPKESFVEIDLYEPIGMENNSFDISVVHHGIDYVYPYKLAFEELKRITKKYVIITIWREFVDKNLIRFNEKGGWNVNDYEASEWYKMIEDVGLEVVVDAKITEFNEKYGKEVYNHLFVLQV
jgi:ubiquinone/menaquinone biosynthesis C-methylase UbiE